MVYAHCVGCCAEIIWHFRATAFITSSDFDCSIVVGHVGEVTVQQAQLVLKHVAVYMVVYHHCM